MGVRTTEPLRFVYAVWKRKFQFAAVAGFRPVGIRLRSDRNASTRKRAPVTASRLRNDGGALSLLKNYLHNCQRDYEGILERLLGGKRIFVSKSRH